MRRLLLLLLPLALLCACTTAPAEQADAPFSFYYRCAEVAYGGEDGVIRAEAAPLEPDAGLRTVVLQYLKGPASPELRTPLPADWALESNKKPNKAHYKLAELEKAGKLTAVVTQNIDGLHQAAGSKRVYELHGSVLRNYCMKCGKSYTAEFIKTSAGVPKCECSGIIKPDVVLYEEGLDDKTVNGAVNAIANADTLIIAGTSLTVYPAAGMVRYFNGNKLVLINRDATPMDSAADLVFHEKVGELLDKIKVNI